MLKKLLAGSIFAFSITSIAYAGNFYIGPTLMLRDTIADHTSMRETGLRLSLGYADMGNGSYYLAAEAFALPTSIVLDNHTSSGTSVRSSYSYGVSVIPGLPIVDAVIGYLRLGMVETRFSSAGVSKPGAQVGLGLQTALTCNWDMRMEYDYTMYRHISNVGSPKSDWVGLGVVYKFDQI